MTGNHVFDATVYGMLAGVVGTGLGGVIAYFLPRIRGNFFSAILGFAAGIMLAVTFLELLIESLAGAGLLPTVMGLVLGMGVFFLLDWLLPHHHPVKPEREDSKEDEYLRKGLLLAVGIALHNFPEGMAIGAGYAVSTNMGLILAWSWPSTTSPKVWQWRCPCRRPGGGVPGCGRPFIRRAHGYRGFLWGIHWRHLFLLAGHIPKLCRRGHALHRLR